MSRNTSFINNNIRVHHGTDHALGAWFDVTDKRYAEHPLDIQGEGYVVEHSSIFDFTNNQIGLTIEDLKGKPIEEQNKIIVEKCDAFILTLPLPGSPEYVKAEERRLKYG